LPGSSLPVVARRRVRPSEPDPEPEPFHRAPSTQRAQWHDPAREHSRARDGIAASASRQDQIEPPGGDTSVNATAGSSLKAAECLRGVPEAEPDGFRSYSTEIAGPV